jgi:hypothetical protein
LLRLGVEGWLCEPRADFDAPDHGVLGNERFPSLMQRAVLELILPGFEHVGVDTTRGRAWWAESGPKRDAGDVSGLPGLPDLPAGA